MKKFNFKVIVVVVMSLILLVAFAACKKPEPTPSNTKSKSPSGPTVSDRLTEVMEGLDLRINNLSELTDRFEADISFFATVNEVDYLVSIKANVDIRDTSAVNESNKLAVEITKDEQVLLGFYYNGAEDAFFLNFPSKNIKRYIDGFDMLATIKEYTDPVEGGFASKLPSDVNLAESIGSILGMAGPIAFSGVTVTEKDNVTTYDFTFNNAISGMLPMLFEIIGDMADDIEGMIDDLFNVEGFKLTEFTIPDFDLHLFANIHKTKGIESLTIDLDVPEFTFKINSEDEGKLVKAFNLDAGISLLIDPAGDSYSVELAVPSIEDTTYTYFSPLNVKTSGQFLLAGKGGTRFDIITDINPFKLTEAEAHILIKKWNNDQTEDDAVTAFELNIKDGNAYADILTYDEVLDADIMKYYKLNIQEGIDLAKNVMGELKNLRMPSFDKGEKTDSKIDYMAVLGLVTKVPGLVIEGVLTIDKAFVQEVIDTLKIEDADLPDDMEITAWLLYDSVDTKKIVGARGEYLERDIEAFVLITETDFKGNRYSPVSFAEDANGTYKIADKKYVLIKSDETYTGKKYIPVDFVKTSDGLYKESGKVTEKTMYAQFLIEGKKYSAEYGEVVVDGENKVDRKFADAVFEVIPQEEFLDGFNFAISFYSYEEGVLIDTDVFVDLTLSDFTFDWSKDYEAGAVIPENAEEYVNALEGVTTQKVIDGIQDIIYSIFGTTITVELNNDEEIIEIKGFAGDAFTAPATPVREGYDFEGWFTGDEEPYTFPATLPEESIFVYAKWTLSEPA